MKKILFFSLAIFAWASVTAQIKLHGKVQSAQNNQPLTDVIVQAQGIGIVETNARGEFFLEAKEPGVLPITFRLLGYETKEIKLIVLAENNEFVTVNLVPTKINLDAVEVTALRANDESPVAFENLNKEEISELNTGRDVPYLLEQMPSVVVSSDAGAGIGYTNMRVRGSDISRINVTVNGIPMNDAESHGVYWVNMPDLASSTSSLQLQRGVGTSTNGSSAFGASLNLETDGPTTMPKGMLHVGGGSFNTQRFTAQFGTGLIKNHWWMNGRLSQIKSDGYLDRASSNLKSYYLSGGFINNKTSVRAVAFGGMEKTYQAWNGVDSATFATNPTDNSAGALYDSNGNVTGYYDNETDNYTQNNYQLHINQELNNNFRLNVSLHYTHGEGYYEQYKQDGDFSYYGLNPIVSGTDTINSTDLVRRKWLDNDFYGAIFNLEYNNDKLTSIVGGGIHNYEGDHFGEIIWARFASQSEIRDHYYNSYSNKLEWNVYWKNLFEINKKFTAYVDLQVRSVKYAASGLDDDVANFDYAQNNFFFNPKAGVTYNLSATDRIFLSYSVGNKEPNRTDLIYADPDDLPKPERLQDIELGYDFSRENLSVKVNAFYMYYTNQLVLTGQLDAVGYPIRKNVGKSYRTGVEVSAVWRPANWMKWSPNITYMLSQNVGFLEDDGNGNITDLGNTAISFSPNIIAGSNLEFYPVKGVTLGLFSKYVSKQYLNNSQVESLTLDGYFVNDVRVSYTLNPSWIDNMRIYINVNNVLSESYASNGYVWGTTPYYYPQALINFLAGVQVNF